MQPAGWKKKITKNLERPKDIKNATGRVENLLNTKRNIENVTRTKSLKVGKIGKILMLNKGGAQFRVKKDEIEILIDQHRPIAFGILEANMPVDGHQESLKIDGYKLEQNNLASFGLRTRQRSS